LKSRLALHGGRPVRESRLPYGQQWIDHDDEAAVVGALRSPWLTTGPAVARFEEAFAAVVGAAEAVAVSNGTAALHASMHALGIGPGDEVIVPAITFVASANCVVYQGATPVFADVTPETLLISPASVAARVSGRTRAIVAVDYAGQPCDYAQLRTVAAAHGLAVVSDACHALGASLAEQLVGTLGDVSAFSLHPVKHITAGEGGVVTTNDERLAVRMRTFRNHGITTDHRQREEQGQWSYQMRELGFNYRLTDLQCALAASQLTKLPAWVERRRAIAARYDRLLTEVPGVQPLALRSGVRHAYHLYVVRVDSSLIGISRDEMFVALRAEGIGVNVHYSPVHLHPYYRERFGSAEGQCPVAEAVSQQVLSLPMFPRMTDTDVDSVVEALAKVVTHYHGDA